MNSLSWLCLSLITANALNAQSATNAAAVGHQFRQDDFPSIAAAPDGSLWLAWLSFVGDRDDIAIRHYVNGQWGSMQWVPNNSGDNWMPQAAVDASNRVWVVWPQQVNNNWDIYARRFDPATQEWSGMERLSNDPLPDTNPRLTSDGKGRLAVAWQGFRRRADQKPSSNIFCRTFDGQKWSSEIRVTNRAANDWEPAAAFDSQGNVWIAYDSYKNGNYDVFLSALRNGKAEGPEIAVAATPRFEARPTIAVDSSDRVWVAWETGMPNWGKDQGYTIRSNQSGRSNQWGVPLGGFREPRIRCWANGKWQQTATPLMSAFTGNTYQPHVFSDGRGSIWVAASSRHNAQNGPGGYWEYSMTHLDGAAWSKAVAIPNSKGRSSTRISAAVTADGNLWAAWPTDNRTDKLYHRPIRQQVFAGMIPAPARVANLSLQPAVEEKIESQVYHADETADLRAMRSYTAAAGGKTLHIVRGDFHRHTELSWDGGGTADGNLQDFYRYMIDVATMDFGASTDHQGGAWPYWWWYTQKMTDMYHVPGGYVPLFGYERSAIFPNGHRNIFYAKRSESRVVPFFVKEGAKNFTLPLAAMGDEPGIGTDQLVANDTKMLYEEIRGRNGLAISHTSATRMGTDWRDNDPDLEPVVEIFQGARANSEQLGAPLSYDTKGYDDLRDRAGYFPEGFVSNAWAKGYKLGIITSSDHGSTHISYAMVYTDDPSRQGVLDAIRKRHTYGAMDNIVMDVRMGTHFMGDEFALSKAQPIRVKARGTRAIAKIDIIKDSKVIYSTEPKQQNVDFQFTDKDSVAGRHYYYVRLQQDDGKLAWSSPFFINYK